jgi:hypothetical protein
MSDRRLGSDLAARGRSVAEWLSFGARRATLMGAWLALTILFLLVGVSILGTGLSAMGYSEGPAYFLVSTFGVLVAVGVSETLARGIVVAGEERLDGALARDVDPLPDRSRDGLCRTNDRRSCRTGCCA